MNYPEPYGMECNEGWKDIIERTHEKLSHIDPDYKIDQIKEKFGGLRYYYSHSFEDYNDIRRKIMDDIVTAAEIEASRTCELCGANCNSDEVEVRSHNYWYFGYCKSCADKHTGGKEYSMLVEL